LINPNGWRLHGYIADFLRHSDIVHFVNEFRSPNFHSGATNGFLLMLLALGILLLGVRPRLRPTEILLIGWAGAFALRWARNIPTFAIVTTPILAEHFNAYLRERWDSRWLRLYRKISDDVRTLDRAASGSGAVALVVAVMLAVTAKPRVLGGAPLMSTEILTNRLPVAAVEFLRARPEVVNGEMFNDYGWGGYLMLVLPERKVFVDGRNDFYGADLMKVFDDVDEVHPNWESVLDKFHIGWTILPNKHALNRVLALHGDWETVYADEVATICARRHVPR
jgi:hypothetical protein